MKKLSMILEGTEAKSSSIDSQGIPIRKVKKTRFFVDNEYLENGYADVFPNSVTLVYCVLAKYANQRSQRCFPSIPTIMKESGIKNRNTVNDAIKILEAYEIIYVMHSKGRISNRYALLDISKWKGANSINIDTIKKQRRVVTVPENNSQQYDKTASNSITDDTRSLINKSDKEILTKLNNSSSKKVLIDPTFGFIRKNYPDRSDDDLKAAYQKAMEGGVDKLSLIRGGSLDKYLNP